MLNGILPERSAEDIFAGRIRLFLGGETYILPTLTIDQEEKWLGSIDGRLGVLLSGMSSAGNNPAALLSVLSGATSQLLDLLYSYDETHVLPPRARLTRTARSSELIRAVMEVWVAANPLAGIALLGMQTARQTNGASPAPTNGQLENGVGTSAPSEDGSAPSSSSPTSMQPLNGSATKPRRRSTR